VSNYCRAERISQTPATVAASPGIAALTPNQMSDEVSESEPGMLAQMTTAKPNARTPAPIRTAPIQSRITAAP
jgi:hypothetical protein